MPFADEYVVSAHPPLPLHSVPRPWAPDTYSTVYMHLYTVLHVGDDSCMQCCFSKASHN